MFYVGSDFINVLEHEKRFRGVQGIKLCDIVYTNGDINAVKIVSLNNYIDDNLLESLPKGWWCKE